MLPESSSVCQLCACLHLATQISNEVIIGVFEAAAAPVLTHTRLHWMRKQRMEHECQAHIKHSWKMPPVCVKCLWSPTLHTCVCMNMCVCMYVCNMYVNKEQHRPWTHTLIAKTSHAESLRPRCQGRWRVCVCVCVLISALLLVHI